MFVNLMEHGQMWRKHVKVGIIKFDKTQYDRNPKIFDKICN